MLYIRVLILEVTERCNLACAHCLRGCSRNIDMQKETVDKILDQCTGGIGSLIFTGGEPTLNLPLLKYTFDQIRERKIPLGSFWLATNGVVNSVELAALLLQNMDLADDPDCCGVAISTDEFHAQDTARNPLRYLQFYDDTKEVEDWNLRYIINMGNAEANGLGMREYNPATEFDIEVENDGEDIAIDQVYVRANGDLLADCDTSYDYMDEHAICKVEGLTQYVHALAGACV